MIPINNSHKIPRKEREYLQHRTEILNTALELFSEKGYNNVSMQEIAEKSEFAVGTLYNYFANKEELYKALLYDIADKFDEALSESYNFPGDELAKIKHWIKAKVSVFMNNLKYFRLFLSVMKSERYDMKAKIDDDIKDSYNKELQKLAALFESGIKKKIFKKYDPYLLAIALDGICTSFFFDYLEQPNKHPFDATVILNIFLKPVYIGEMYEE